MFPLAVGFFFFFAVGNRDACRRSLRMGGCRQTGPLLLGLIDLPSLLRLSDLQAAALLQDSTIVIVVFILFIFILSIRIITVRDLLPR